MSENKYLEAAKSHFRALGKPSIEIPEWIVEDKPMRIYWNPLTVLEQQEFVSSVATDLDIVVSKALDADGRKMFTIEHKPELKRCVAPQIIQRIALRMMQLPSPEQVEKN